ncbi:vomeronasal type-2 receptor 26-like [Gastrophryne carolinensis]
MAPTLFPREQQDTIMLIMMEARYDYLANDFQKRTLALEIEAKIAAASGTTFFFTQITQHWNTTGKTSEAYCNSVSAAGRHSGACCFHGDQERNERQKMAFLLAYAATNSQRNAYDGGSESGMPVSRSSEHCPPGTRKKLRSSVNLCCYDCVPCAEGEISNSTDSENCMKCPQDEWPNKKKDRCIPKHVEFLSYTEDISMVLIFISVLFSLVTVLIMGIFIFYLDTSIVKANNRSLSFVLLVSIFLSFLCIFLFLGRPVDITCMLRQVSFGIFFTIAVSCVLAKTITVYIAFKATKPGSYWNRWIGVKLANYIVLICSSVQVLICVIWLSASPPYQEHDMSTYPGKIIIQCNEGSVISFYIVLGYMGFLAAVSFVLAFMVRTLPDTYNEAKYITFSMLVFCSVWIAMIPAYLSTRGKYTVAVEIFAILTSSAGLLSCIFFPKLYIIILKPERNTKIHVTEKKNISVNLG